MGGRPRAVCAYSAACSGRVWKGRWRRCDSPSVQTAPEEDSVVGTLSNKQQLSQPLLSALWVVGPFLLSRAHLSAPFRASSLAVLGGSACSKEFQLCLYQRLSIFLMLPQLNAVSRGGDPHWYFVLLPLL